MGHLAQRLPVLAAGPRTRKRIITQRTHMTKPHIGNVPGAQQHAEGQQGDKTRETFREQIATARDAPDPTEPEGEPNRPGKHRLTEDRQQHDEAEKNSEHDRERR
jgi:hypothetical protein